MIDKLTISYFLSQTLIFCTEIIYPKIKIKKSKKTRQFINFSSIRKQK